MNLTLECEFMPGKKTVYTWRGLDEQNKKRIIEIDRKTFLRELEIHGEPIRKSSRITELGAVIFKYEY